jgi:NAD(P)-dependent dehydrogenase (short-subunit alcohol dehydrogenase family)
MVDMFSLKGKNAIVIGGSRGLGKGMAAGLAAAGAEKIIISSRNQQELDSAAAELNAIGDTRVTGIALDIRSLAAVRAYVDGCASRLGHIDILINSAGINVRKPALDFTEEDWDQVMDTQLKFVFFMCQAVARHMRDKGIHGKIINVGSLTSVLGFRNIVAYCAAKGGVLQLTKALANELADCNVNVNAIGPGYFETEMSKPLFQDPATVKRFIERIPQRRTGFPEDLAGAAIYLASAASDYMTGQIIYVDGGWLIN